MRLESWWDGLLRVQHLGSEPSRGPRDPAAGLTAGILGPGLGGARGTSCPPGCCLQLCPVGCHGTGCSWKGTEMRGQQRSAVPSLQFSGEVSSVGPPWGAAQRAPPTHLAVCSHIRPFPGHGGDGDGGRHLSRSPVKRSPSPVLQIGNGGPERVCIPSHMAGRDRAGAPMQWASSVPRAPAARAGVCARRGAPLTFSGWKRMFPRPCRLSTRTSGLGSLRLRASTVRAACSVSTPRRAGL